MRRRVVSRSERKEGCRKVVRRCQGEEKEGTNGLQRSLREDPVALDCDARYLASTLLDLSFRLVFHGTGNCV